MHRLTRGWTVGPDGSWGSRVGKKKNIHREEKNVMLDFMLSFFWLVMPIFSLCVNSHYSQTNLTLNKGPRSVFQAADPHYTTWHGAFCVSALQSETRPERASHRWLLLHSYSRGGFFKIKKGGADEGKEGAERLISCCCWRNPLAHPKIQVDKEWMLQWII